MVRQSYDPLNDPNVRKETRPNGRLELFGPGNKHLGPVAAPLSPAEIGRRQYEQDSAYIAARDGKPSPAPAAVMPSGIRSSGGLGPTSLSNNTYGQPINRASAGLPTPQEVMSARSDDPERAKRIAAAREAGTFDQTVADFNHGNAGRQRMDTAGNIFDLQTPYQRSMDAVNRGDRSGFNGLPATPNRPTPLELFAGKTFNPDADTYLPNGLPKRGYEGSPLAGMTNEQVAEFARANPALAPQGFVSGYKAPSVTYGSKLPKGYAGYQTADGKYKTIGPNGEVGIHENEQAAIAKLNPPTHQAAMAQPEVPGAPRRNAAMANQVKPEDEANARRYAAAALKSQQVAPAPGNQPLPSYADIFTDRGAVGVAGRATADTGRGLVAGAKFTDELGAEMANQAVRFVGGRQAADAFVVPTQRQVFTTGVNSARILLNNIFMKPRAASPQVMPYNAPGNPISAAPTLAPQVTPAMQTGTGALGDLKPLQDALRTTSPTAQLNQSMRRPQQVAANVFTRPRNFSMRGGFVPA